MPTARSIPSSRVRSIDGQHQRVDDPDEAHDHRERQQRIEQVEELLDRLDEVRLELVARLHLRVGEPGHVALSVCGVRVADAVRRVDQNHLVPRTGVVLVEEDRRDRRVPERGAAVRLLVGPQQPHVDALAARELRCFTAEPSVQVVALRVVGVGEEAIALRACREPRRRRLPVESDPGRHVRRDRGQVVVAAEEVGRSRADRGDVADARAVRAATSRRRRRSA